MLSLIWGKNISFPNNPGLFAFWLYRNVIDGAELQAGFGLMEFLIENLFETSLKFRDEQKEILNISVIE